MSSPIAKTSLITEYGVKDFGMIDHSGMAGPYIAAVAEPGAGYCVCCVPRRTHAHGVEHAS
jgi:hypothetical protein